MELLNSTGVKLRIDAIPMDEEIHKLIYSPDGKEFGYCNTRRYEPCHMRIRPIGEEGPYLPLVTIHVINPHTGTVLKELSGMENCAIFLRSFNGRESGSRILDSLSDSLIDSLINGSRLGKLLLEPANKYAVLASDSTTLVIIFWDSTFGAKLIKFKYVLVAPDATSILRLVFSPSKEQLATAQDDGTVRIFHIKLLNQLIRACRYLHLKETLLVKQICDDILQKKQATLTVGSPEAQIFDVLPKPIRICLSEHIEKLPNSGMAKKPIC